MKNPRLKGYLRMTEMETSSASHEEVTSQSTNRSTEQLISCVILMNALAGINPGQIVIDWPSYGSPGFITR